MVYLSTTGAVTFWACNSYDTKALFIVFNQGSQMVAAAKENINWKAVLGGITEKGVRWETVPTQCQCRNGIAKWAIQMAKRTLKKKHEAEITLDFQELQATFQGMAAI